VNGALSSSTEVDFVEEFAAAAERFAVAVAWTDQRAVVPTCPRWTVRQLVVHVANVHAWAATVVETGRAAHEQDDEPSSSRPRQVSQWYAGKAEDLYEVLRSTDPGRPCWNFAFGLGVAGFWRRRQLHETTVHLLDLDAAGGRATELTPVVAADGVDEVLTVFLPRMHQRGHVLGLDRPLALTATDTGDTWLLAPRPRAAATGGLPTVQRRRSATSAVPDRLEAEAATLYRLLWGRSAAADADVSFHGDHSRLTAFLGSRLVP